LFTSRVYPVRLVHELTFEEGESRFELSRDQILPGASASGIDESFSTNGGQESNRKQSRLRQGRHGKAAKRGALHQSK